MVFAVLSRVFKMRQVTVAHPSGGGVLQINRVAGFPGGPVATAKEYARYLKGNG